MMFDVICAMFKYRTQRL